MYLLSTQEALAASRHDLKIIDCNSATLVCQVAALKSLEKLFIFHTFAMLWSAKISISDRQNFMCIGTRGA